MMLNISKLFYQNLLIFIQLWSFQIVVFSQPDDFEFNIGDLKLFCPTKPDDDWKLVGTDCFNKLPEPNRLEWSEANMICSTEKNSASQLLHLQNFLLHKELSRIFDFQSKNCILEFWTAWFINFEDGQGGQLPDRISRFGSNESASIYNPIWAALEPQVDAIGHSPGKWCISWDAHIADQNQFGWRLRNCSDLLPTICQTFPCFLDSNSRPQHRCSDNSACISHLAICDGFADCANGEDEANCGECPCNGIQALKNLAKIEFSTLFGNIYANKWPHMSNPSSLKGTANGGNCCTNQEWIIKQKPGARIKLNFLDLNLDAGDKIQIVDQESGETNKILDNSVGSTYSMLLAANNVKIIFSHADKSQMSHKNENGEKFHLQYSVDEAAICHRRFESWNGSFSTPMRIPDNGLYKVPMDCRWKIENQAQGIVAIKFNKFQLAQNDELIIYADKNLLIGNFSSSQSPPMALLLNTPQIYFDFNARKMSEAGKGFEVAFERACLNQLLNMETHGQIEIHDLMASKDSEIHCSWLIKILCNEADGGNCPFTIFVDKLNATEDDKITFKNGDEEIYGLDATKKINLPFQFRSNSDFVKIRIRVASQNFNAKFTYSIDCIRPLNVIILQRNGQKSSSAQSFPFRSIVHFECPKAIEGGGKLICEFGGKWKLVEENGNGASCFLEAKGPLKGAAKLNFSSPCVVPIIENGFILALNRTKGQMRFGCQFGYDPLEPKIVHCMRDGQWAPEPKCQEITCPDAPAETLPSSKFLLPAQLVNRSRGNLVGSRAFYKCPDGSEQKGGGAFAECRENGTWNGPRVFCLSQQCPLTAIENAGKFFLHNSEEFNFVGSNLSIYCRTAANDKSIFIGPMGKMECQKSGEWSGNEGGNLPEKCTIAISCSTPIFPNSEIKIKGISRMEYGINEIVEFECAKGKNDEFLMIGVDKAVCLPNGKWSNGPPICIEGDKNSQCLLPAPDVHSLLIADKEKISVGEKVTFHCAQPNYRLSDPTPRTCIKAESKIPKMQKRKKRENADDDKNSAHWISLIRSTIPSMVVAFDSAKQGNGGWKASTHWTQLGNGRWSYRPLGGGKNFLISPMVEVSAKDWLDVSVELAPIPCQNCLVWLSYFSAESGLDGPPPNEHFTPLGGVLADPTVHAIQFSLDHPRLWVQISVDDQSPELRMERMKITITACPKLQLGATLFPRTPVKSENHTVQGQCTNGQGNKAAMGLICSPLGKWFAAKEEFVDLCGGGSKCQNGECSAGAGSIQCHFCNSQTSPNCLQAVSLEESKFCASNQICFVRTMSNGTGQMPFGVLRGCANRMECGIFQPNISIRESCKTSLDGIETCQACCSDPLCNSKLPSKLLKKTKTFLSTTPIPPTEIMTPKSAFEFFGQFDGPMPECIDQQPLELECEQQIQIHRILPDTIEPVLISWPKVIDNDPNFRLFPLNIPLAHPNEQITLQGDENEILWKAEDQHGFAKICSTKVEFVDAPKNFGEFGANSAFQNAQIECPDIFIHEVNIKNAKLNNEGIFEIPTEYPPIKFNAPQGSLANIKLSFDPPSGTLLEIDVPKLITVSAGSQNGECQFWYQSKAIDCPLRQLGPDWEQFECTNSDLSTKKCTRRTPCPGGMEYPTNLRELHCRMNQSNQSWTFLAGSSNEGEEHELLGEPMCIEEISSTISLSMELLPVGPANSVNCMRLLAQRIRPHLTQFLQEKCPQVQWTVQSHSIQSQSFVQNFSTSDYKSNRDVLLCIELLTTELSKSLPKNLNPPLPVNECPNGPISARRQTIAYHLHCPNGWAPNDQLRCQLCPKGHFLFNETCLACPLGTFSPVLGTQECQKCRNGLSTAREGASKESECLPFCSAGFFSLTGLAPCLPCPLGTFQSMEGQSECQKCPNGLNVGKKAAKEENECKNSNSPFQLGHSIEIKGNCSNKSLGFTGPNCEIPLDLCAAEFCLNGGICSFDKNLGSKCDCKENFAGQRCEINNKESEIKQCTNGQIKENICECNLGFKMNESKKECTQIDLCEFSKPCQTGSDCKAEKENSFKCSCKNEFSGEFCHLPRQNCFEENFKCLNGGECAWIVGPRTADELPNFDTKCLCPTKFDGERCQKKRETQMAKCIRENWCGKNFVSGKCKIDEQNGGIVYCDFGENFEENLCESMGSLCKNGGTCISLMDGDNRTKCSCLDGYFGSNCENEMDYCGLEEICMNGGKCQSNENDQKYTCKCDEQAEFTGENCEKGILTSTNICEPNPCFNDGKCVMKEGGIAFKCECPTGYSPADNCQTLLDPCQQDPQYCNDAGECRLLPNSKFRYCHCLPQYAGIRCESKRPSHFNIYFADPKSQAMSPIRQQIVSTQFKCAEALDEFSFCIWVKFGEIGGGKFDENGKQPFAVLKMQNDGILFQLHKKYAEIFVESGSHLIIPYGQNVDELREQIWHHICLISSIGFDSKANVQMHFDGLFTNGEGVEFKWDRAALYSDATCEIVLGESGEKNSKREEKNVGSEANDSAPFVGQISLAELYYEALTEEQLTQKTTNCQKWSRQNAVDLSNPKIPWTDFTSIDPFNSAQMEILPGICANSDCQPGQLDGDCEGTKISKLPPVPIGCPKSQYIYVPDAKMRMTTVDWDDSLENMFQAAGPNPIVRYESNFRPGQSFGWGHFRVVYLAEDAAGNWATCEFDIVIAPDKCQEPNVDPQEYTLLRLHELGWEEDPQASMRAQIQCHNVDEFVFNTARPPFYTCDRLGQWNRWEKFGSPFTLPSCSPTDNAMQEVEGDVHFQGNCTQMDKYVDDVIHCVINASNTMGGFCEKENCEGQLVVKTDCLDKKMAAQNGGIILLPSAGVSLQVLGDNSQHQQQLGTMLGRRVVRQKRVASKNDEKRQNAEQQTIRVQFDLNVNNTKRAVGPAIRDSMENWFGNGFKGEQIRLSCSDSFPQLHVGNGEGGENSGLMSSDEAASVQCATCAPGETWQSNEHKMATATNTESVLNSDASGNCVKCPVDTYKPKEGVQPCTQCPDGRITGGITGCMNLAECYINCEPGSIYNWGMDQCRPCPRGQYMEYSGRLKCMACPTGKTTESEGSTSAQQCSMHCPPGEMIGVDEHCQPCKKGTFRETQMDICKQCELGFSTEKDGTKAAKDCDQIYCPPGSMRNPKIDENEKYNQKNSEFAQICQSCPIGYYQNEYGSTKCIRCPTGFITQHPGAHSPRECDQPWDGTCKPDEPNPCPDGMECVQIRGSIFECHTVPEQNDVDEAETGHLKRIWIPIGLSIISVIILAILLLMAVLNRKKWLLIFHRHFPKAALLCCKKMTVDNLSNSDFARTDAPPIGNTAAARPEALSLEQIERPIPPQNVDGIHQIKVDKSAADQNSMENASSNGSALAQRKMTVPSKNLPIAIVRPNNGSPDGRRRALSESSSNASDPLNEIRTSLMEVLNSEEGVKGAEDNFKEQEEMKPIRPKLTVQTTSLWEQNRRNVAAVEMPSKIPEPRKFDYAHTQRRRTSSSSSVSTSRSIAQKFAKNREEEQFPKYKMPPLYSGEKMLASALATDPVGRHVFVETDESNNRNPIGKGISGLRRNKNSPQNEGAINQREPMRTNLLHSAIRSSITGRTAKIIPAANRGTMANKPQEMTNKPPSLAAEMAKSRAKIGEETPKTVPLPSYDDDDDAFFS